MPCSSIPYCSRSRKIGIAEFDLVDETNLQRQVLYGSADVGKLKSIIAKTRLKYLNSNVELEIFNLKCDASNSLRILKNWDVIVDATDNLSSRYIINDACVILGKPMVHGAVYKYEGVVSVFNYKGDQLTDVIIPRQIMMILKILYLQELDYLACFRE